MSVPKSVMKINKGGITYISSVDRVQYTMNELSRAAMRDVGKYIRKLVIAKQKGLPGLKKGKRPYTATQFWVRPKEADLQIGFGNSKKGTTGDTWYAIQQELGQKNQPARHFLRETVYDNIPKIIEIESKYISSLEDEARALALIDENNEGENDEGT